MAVTRVGNVWSATADGDIFTNMVDVKGIKVVGGGSGITVNLKKASSTGSTLYSAIVATSTERFEQVELRSPKGIYVNISAGSGTVYLYLR